MDLLAPGIALLMLVAFALLALGVRRFGPRSALTGGAQSLQIVGARRLDMHTTLFLVEVEGRRLLIGSGRDGARLVADLTPGR